MIFGGSWRSCGSTVLPVEAVACFQEMFKVSFGVKVSMMFGMISAVLRLVGGYGQSCVYGRVGDRE